MYRIAVLSKNRHEGQQLAIWIKEYCSFDGNFPQVSVYEDREQFYLDWNATSPSAVIVDLPGVAGLNEVEHIRSICSRCGLIWCSDLDFSLHAFRLRADYFILAPVSRQSLWEGLCVWAENRNRINGVYHSRDRQELVKGSVS